MTSNPDSWTKNELQAYILFLCANADGVEGEGEINVIKSKVDPDTYTKIHKEFLADSKDDRLRKVEDAIHLHHYSEMELAEFRREMYEVFFADCDFKQMEKYLDQILDNILY